MSKKIYIDRYEYIEDLGYGGMAKVEKVYDKHLKRYAAIKTMNVNLSNDSSKRFQNEAEVMARLNHPYLVTLYDYFLEKNYVPYIVMEYIDNGTLDNLVCNKDILEFEKSINIVIKISEALEYLHKNNIIHRDIKPSNILIRKDGKPKLSDLGISKMIDKSTITVSNQLLGTYIYMSPEQAKGIEVTQASDIYSLGVVFYQIITGELPIKSENECGYIYQHINKIPKKPSKINNNIPKVLDTIIMKMLEKKLEKRYKNIDSLISDLKSVNYNFGKNLKRVINKKDNGIIEDIDTITIGNSQENIKTFNNISKKINNFVFIQGGIFQMGSLETEFGRNDNELLHPVKLNNFYIGKNTVTTTDFNKFIEETNYNVSNIEYYNKYSTKRNHPAVFVSWNNAKDYCKWLSNKYNEIYRLPTEAEWEYACRAGTQTEFNTGTNLTTNQANYNGNYPYNSNEKGNYIGSTQPIKSYPANNWGIYDMHGNVYEWCEDYYDENYYKKCKSKGIVENVINQETTSKRVLRGGGWRSMAINCRSAFRNYSNSDYSNYYIGFRIVFVP